MKDTITVREAPAALAAVMREFGSTRAQFVTEDNTYGRIYELVVAGTDEDGMPCPTGLPILATYEGILLPPDEALRLLAHDD